MSNSKTTSTKRIVYREADKGRFVTPGYASRHPKTTIRETIKPPPKSK